MTPRQFFLLVDRRADENKRQDRRAGEVVALLYNVNRDTKKDPRGIDWLDVFPEWKEEARQTEERMLETMEMWVAATSKLPPS